MSDGIVPGKPIRLYQGDGTFADFSTEDVVASGQNSFLGWKCGAGVENLCINFDGDVQSASCGSLPDGTLGKYGNIFEDFKLSSEWMSCPQQFCSCGADLFIPKVKSWDYNDHLKFLRNGTHELEKRTEKVSSPVGVERTFSVRNKQVFWEIGRRCNYDCSYCHPYVHNSHEENKSLEKLKHAVQKLEEQFGRGNKINFAISGGEPTVNPDYMEFARFIHGKSHKLSTHSNGSRLPVYYTELINYSDLNISVHFEFFNRFKMLEVLTAIAREIFLRKTALCEVGHLEVMLMALPNKKDEVHDFEKEIWEIPYFNQFCTLNVMPIRGHESIEAKEKKSGDVVLNKYKKEELKENFGHRTREAAVLLQTKSLEELATFDDLDNETDPVKRKEMLARLVTGNPL